MGLNSAFKGLIYVFCEVSFSICFH